MRRNRTDRPRLGLPVVAFLILAGALAAWLFANADVPKPISVFAIGGIGTISYAVMTALLGQTLNRETSDMVRIRDILISDLPTALLGAGTVPQREKSARLALRELVAVASGNGHADGLDDDINKLVKVVLDDVNELDTIDSVLTPLVDRVQARLDTKRRHNLAPVPLHKTKEVTSGE